MKWGVVKTAIFFGSLMSGSVLAQTSSPDSTAVLPEFNYSPSLFGIVVKLIISMVLIVGLIYLFTYLFKKLNGRVSGGGAIGDTIKIIGRTYLSPKQILYLVKIGGKYSVLGATESSINMISQLDDEEAHKLENLPNKTGIESSGGRFAEILKGIIRQ